MNRISNWVYCNLLPIYIPTRWGYTAKLHLAIWCAIDARRAGRLRNVLKGTRITIRKNHSPILVIKKGEV
jgi:hypothetical protein